MDLQGLHEHCKRLYTILTELFANALEHGLLGLDPGLKHTPQGFAVYVWSQGETNVAHHVP